MLDSRHGKSQTSGIMKTLSRTSKAVILVAIGVVAILSFRAFAQPYSKPTEPPASKATFVLKVKNVAPLTNPDHFEDVLKHLKTQLYDVVIHRDDGTQNHLLPGSSGKLDIKTDKVTTSKVAENGQPGGATHMGLTHMTRMIGSNYSSDISTVLNELKQ